MHLKKSRVKCPHLVRMQTANVNATRQQQVQ